MISLDQIKHLHLELSSMCNARCALCSRNYHGFPYNKGYEESNLSLDQIKLALTKEFLLGLDEILVNGTYGDFVMNPDSVDILSWLRLINPNMRIHVSTNGGARDHNFWKALSKLNLEISFCIDGLEDTHHIYRQDTTYKQVIKNATTYIQSGGRAIWTMTEFDHNLHQFQEAEERSKLLGFVTFNRRPTNRNSGPVYDRGGNLVYIMRPSNRKYPEKIDEKWIDTTGARHIPDIEPKRIVPIRCQSKEENSLYMSAQGDFEPCCFLGLAKSATKNPAILKLRQYPRKTLEQAIEWYNIVEQSWSTKQLKVCQEICQIR